SRETLWPSQNLRNSRLRPRALGGYGARGLTLRAGSLDLQWRSVPRRGGDLRERLALLPAHDLAPRVAERHDGDDVVFVGEAEFPPHVLEADEAGPVRTDAVAPRRQHDRLDGAARVRDRVLPVRLHVGDDDCRGGAGGVGAGANQRPQLAQALALTHEDEVPRLAVVRAGAQPARLHDPV